MDRTAALAALADMVQATIAPTLSGSELSRLLRRAQIADRDGNAPDDHAGWTAATPYAAGSVVVPTARNGYAYVATTGGVSGASQPTWPTTLALTVVDGTVLWTCLQAAGWAPTYDGAWLNAAAAEGWRMKAAKLGAEENFSADGASFDPDKRRAFCLEMAREYRRKVAGSTVVEGRTAQAIGASLDPAILV